MVKSSANEIPLETEFFSEIPDCFPILDLGLEGNVEELHAFFLAWKNAFFRSA